MKVKRKIIEIDEQKCNGCGLCASACAEGAINIINGKAKLISESYCDGLAACLGECPEGALRIVEKEAEPFDMDAVERHLKVKSEKGDRKPELTDVLPCGCPSTHIQIFSSPSGEANIPSHFEGGAKSELTHWPIQIRLVPPNAPFLKNSHLLVVADCTPVAYPNLHNDFLKGKVLLMGCPKFDDVEEYVEKFRAIFSRGDIKGVTVLIMEVPCCSKLPNIVRSGMVKAGVEIPVELVTIGVKGDIKKRETI
ncbi:MAG: 4Fe-4S binding protein [Syntrophorhabdaceae bacterium]|nr:4Fe-4S binding protein [Syntrophorhabdaceae bacterium]